MDCLRYFSYSWVENSISMFLFNCIVTALQTGVLVYILHSYVCNEIEQFSPPSPPPDMWN